MSQLANTILDDCAEVFKAARRSVYEGAALLYQIDRENAWEGHFSGYVDNS